MEEILRSIDKCYRCKDIVYNILPPKIVVKGFGVSCARGFVADCLKKWNIIVWCITRLMC